MRLIKIASLLGLCIVHVQLLHSQGECNLTFYGKVTDERGEPLPGTTVTLGDLSRTSVTDELGHFRIERLCATQYKVLVKYVGFQDFQSEIVMNLSLEKTISLQPQIAQLEEVVIRAHQAHTEHAHNSVNLNAKQLAEAAGKTLGETLKEIPGVNTIQAGPGIFKPVIHGVHSQRILILNYGVRQEGQQWGAEHAPEIDPFVASNIVVIKDASSIKYGTDALGGVVIVNPAPLPETNDLGGSLNTILQSNGRSATISGMVEGGIKNYDGWGWRIQGTAKRTGDFHTPDYSLTNTGVREM